MIDRAPADTALPPDKFADHGTFAAVAVALASLAVVGTRGSAPTTTTAARSGIRVLTRSATTRTG